MKDSNKVFLRNDLSGLFYGPGGFNVKGYKDAAHLDPVGLSFVSYCYDMSHVSSFPSVPDSADVPVSGLGGFFASMVRGSK